MPSLSSSAGAAFRERSFAPASVRVLQALRSAGKPLGAYDVLDRLASRSAFIACSHAHERGKAALFMVCERCGRRIAFDLEPIAAELSGVAAQARTETAAIQAVERCSACADGEADDLTNRDNTGISDATR